MKIIKQHSAIFQVISGFVLILIAVGIFFSYKDVDSISNNPAGYRIETKSLLLLLYALIGRLGTLILFIGIGSVIIFCGLRKLLR